MQKKRREAPLFAFYLSSHLKSATQSAASRATKAANAAISRFIAQNSSISSFLEWVSEVTVPSCAQTMSSMRQPYLPAR